MTNTEKVLIGIHDMYGGMICIINAAITKLAEVLLNLSTAKTEYTLLDSNERDDEIFVCGGTNTHGQLGEGVQIGEMFKYRLEMHKIKSYRLKISRKWLWLLKEQTEITLEDIADIGHINVMCLTRNFHTSYIKNNGIVSKYKLHGKLLDYTIYRIMFGKYYSWDFEIDIKDLEKA